MKPFFVTTPIYYVNDRPHIGTAYSTIAVDVLARYQRLRGRETRFLTGLDEHGLKLERRAKQEDLSPQDFVDRMAPPFLDAWTDLGCAYDDFIRTTSRRHKERAQELWRTIEAKGDIYLGQYEDWYCVDCEVFYTEKDLLEGHLCPIHKKAVERVKEESYFFRLSAYTERLLAFYESHPTFVRPESRFNEVKSFVKEGLRDLSVSRTSFRWGIPVPNHPSHVMYVWFDALSNYITALGGPEKDGKKAALFETFWPPASEAIHVVGKDILRFHAVYWPAFLMSAGIEPPTQVWAHGWLTVDGDKMSKSAGNFLAPGPLVEMFGADVLRYYLMREIAFGQDGDFSHANLLARYRGDLGNGLGNLLNRIVASIVHKEFGGQVPAPNFATLTAEDQALIDCARTAARNAAQHFDSVAPHRALEAIWELVTAANRYVDQTAPWALRKEGKTARLAQVTYTVLETLRWISVLLWPVMPQKCDALRSQLGLGPLYPTRELDRWPSAWGGLAAGSRARSGDTLFPRFDPEREARLLGVEPSRATQAPEKPHAKPSKSAPSKPKAEAEAKTSTAEPESKSVPTYDDFTKIELRLGLVTAAERVPKSDKLLRLTVDLGESEPRQIVAGIGHTYAPEALLGKRLAIVANLPPRKLMGLVSQGMVLAASDANHMSVLGVDKDLEPGALIR